MVDINQVLAEFDDCQDAMTDLENVNTSIDGLENQIKTQKCILNHYVQPCISGAVAMLIFDNAQVGGRALSDTSLKHWLE